MRGDQDPSLHQKLFRITRKRSDRNGEEKARSKRMGQEKGNFSEEKPTSRQLGERGRLSTGGREIGNDKRGCHLRRRSKMQPIRGERRSPALRASRDFWREIPLFEDRKDRKRERNCYRESRGEKKPKPRGRRVRETY